MTFISAGGTFGQDALMEALAWCREQGMSMAWPDAATVELWRPGDREPWSVLCHGYGEDGQEIVLDMYREGPLARYASMKEALDGVMIVHVRKQGESNG